MATAQTRFASQQDLPANYLTFPHLFPHLGSRIAIVPMLRVVNPAVTGTVLSGEWPGEVSLNRTKTSVEG